MSRHAIPAKNPSLSMVAGWDNALMTFFAQVHDSEAEEDEDLLLWIGTSPRECHDLSDLRAALSP